MSVLKLEPDNDKYVTELIKNADKNGDGVIDFKEFQNSWDLQNKFALNLISL